MSKSLSGKIAVVTGGSRGIGSGIALEFAKRGANVAITFVSNTEAAESTVGKLKALGVDAIAIKANVGNADAAKIIVSGVLEGFQTSKIDILVNNAGIPVFGNFDTLTAEQFDHQFHVNLRGPILIIKEVLPVIARGGRIINVSSRASRVAYPDPYALYAASKAGLDAVTRTLATSWAEPKGITVNTIMPGPVATDLAINLPADVIKELEAESTVGHRLGTVDDIAQVAAFLAEENSRWVNGDTISATGGGYMF